MKKYTLSARGDLDLSLSVPGSKSYSNRALILAAMAQGESLLRGISLSDDTHVMIEALGKLGVNVRLDANDVYVEGLGRKFFPYHGVIDVGPAGTAMRFLAALCSCNENCEIVLQGSQRMHQRPIGQLVSVLKSIGANIEYLEHECFAPLKISGRRLDFSKLITMKGDISSQFLSAVLLLAPMADSGLKISIEGEQISRSYIDMTFAVMKSFGIEVKNDNYLNYEISCPQNFNGIEYQVEGDASGASYFWGMAAISGGRVKIDNLGSSSVQGDVHFPSVLESMGCKVRKREDWIEVQGPVKLRATEVDMELMPDTAQTLAVVAAFAEGSTKITGLCTLRSKETDRLVALQNELGKMEVLSEIGEDYIVVHGTVPHAATIETYDDHRMAMAFAMAALKLPGMEILNPDVVSKSFPDFWDQAAKMVEIRES